ncbi:hypothetical protein SZ41_12050 [Brachyspira hyodysenteriae]|uniref:hypothetical protein n=1 Tax=Brachyspira hyodysenteriae TaxID=159 RepID=UPI00063D989B|nr:hypothetical protein [Brachyspira hyodysenteriae]KLI46098.1 hypothetical protein SZ41_12050 [Brachyspira hyodysenteriae]HJH54780.1 hypothetical protein [Brachyspira hyodysenteriae]
MKCDMCKKNVDEVEENIVELVFDYLEGFPTYDLCEDCAWKVRGDIENYHKKQKEKEKIYGS